MSQGQLGSTTRFIGSFAFDHRLTPYDIVGSVAHATMLGKKKIIPQADANKIVRGLKSIWHDIQKGWVLPEDEDIHFAIERELINRVGDAGKKLHTGRSRNDQVATDLHLYLKDNTDVVIDEITRVQANLVKVATRYKSQVFPGYTHLQHAQPILFAHHLLAYAWMLERDKGRFRDAYKRADVMPLGSAALAGTSFKIDRKLTAKFLGFKNVSENSLDATASRDAVLEFLAAAAILMSNLSRLAEEFINWSSEEFGFIQLSDEFTSGSSIMPQKRNPDVAELVRGETGRVYGSLVAMLTIIKGLPLAYNRDLQEDKPPLFDTVDTLMASLSVMAPMIGTLKINSDRMDAACDSGFLEATEIADFLARRGVPFRAAHGTVRELVQYCLKRKVKFRDLSLTELKRFDPNFDKSIYSVLTPKKAVSAKTSYGGTSPESVQVQLKKLAKLIKNKKI